MRACVRTLIALLSAIEMGCQGPSPESRASGDGHDTGPVEKVKSPGGHADGAASTWVLPTPTLGYVAREGRTLFGHYCSTCHGAAGHGDGFNAYNLDPKPRDLGDPAWQSKRTDVEIEAVIRMGGGAAGLSTGMPPWGKTLSDRQITYLVAFVRTLQPEK